MKYLALWLIVVVASWQAAFGQRIDLTLEDGVVLKEAQIVEIREEDVVITSLAGTTTVPKKNVPLEILARAAIDLKKVPNAQEAREPKTQQKSGSKPEPVAAVPSATGVAPLPQVAAALPQTQSPTPGTQKVEPDSKVWLNVDTALRELKEPYTLPLYVSVVPAFVALLSIASIVLLLRLRRRKQEQLDEVKLQQERSAAQIAQLQDRYGNVISVDEERARITGEIEVLGKQLATAKSNFQDSSAVLDKLKKTISLYQDDINMIEFGFYPKRYDFDISQRFKDAIESVRERQKEMLKSGGAFVCDKDWVVEGSRAEGQRMIKKYERLMLRAFNGEADSTIADVTWSNVSRVEARLDASFEAINKLGESYSCRVTRDYFKLKLDELRLTYEYKEKVRAEKEEQRRIQEQIREEERAQKEIERALKEAEDEEGRYRKALDRARSELLLAGGEEIEKQKRKIAELEQQLRDAHEKRERAISRAQLTKSGHVYIISNIGSFGENKFKIGMTRRLDPLDRVRELSDASVPFDFDVHAIIYTEDAPGFENRLHQHFSSQRVNKVNERKEFFDVSIDEIETAVRQMNAKIDIIKTPEARDYRQTLALVGRASS